MTGPVTFVDTNILIYSHDLTEEVKRPIAQRALDALWLSETGVLSVQILQEFYNVATRKFSPPMPPAEARDVVSDYSSWQVIRPDTALILDASRLEERDSVSFWDALIIEAAKRAGATRLLTEDLQHGRRFGSVTVENPFVEEPAT